MRKSVIYKYTFNDTLEPLVLPLPPYHNITHAGEQNGKVVIWIARTVGDDNLDAAIFYLIGTGQEYDADELFYLHTVQMSNGLVWHVMQRIS